MQRIKLALSWALLVAASGLVVQASCCRTPRLWLPCVLPAGVGLPATRSALVA